MRKHRILAFLLIFFLLSNVSVWAEDDSKKSDQEKAEETTVAEVEDKAEESELSENMAVVEVDPRVAEFKEARIRFQIPEVMGNPQKVAMAGTQTISYAIPNDRILDIETSPDVTSAEIHNLRDQSEAQIRKLFEQAEEGYKNLMFAVSEGDIVYFNEHPFFRFEGVYQGGSLISYQTVVNGYYVTMRVQDFKANGKPIRENVKEMNEEILNSMEILEALPAQAVTVPGAGSSWIIFAVLLGIIAVIGISYYLSERKAKEAKQGKEEKKTSKK